MFNPKRSPNPPQPIVIAQLFELSFPFSGFIRSPIKKSKAQKIIWKIFTFLIKLSGGKSIR